MSSQTVTVVGVNVDLISKEIDRENHRDEKSRSHRLMPATPVKDSLVIDSQKGKYASQAECATPKKPVLDLHEELKEGKAKLLNAIRDALGKGEKGKKLGPSEIEMNLDSIANEAISELEGKIFALQGKGKEGLTLESLKGRLGALVDAHDDYRSKLRAAFENPGNSSSSTNTESFSQNISQPAPVTEKSTPVEPEVETFWKRLEAIGIVNVKDPSKRDLGKVGGNIDILKKRFSLLSEEIKAKKTELKQAQAEEALKKASTPETKAEGEKKVKELQAALEVLTTKHVHLQKAIIQGEFIYEHILRRQVAQELGTGPQKLESPETEKKVPSASVGSSHEEEVNSTSNRSSTILQTASVNDGVRGNTHSISSVRTNSGDTPRGDVGGPDVTTPTAVPLTAANDFSGTTLAIASTNSNLRSEARKTDQLIKKLLRACLQGNWEAVKMALVFLDKRASLITIGMGAQTIKSMQYYEKSMSALSNSLGTLKGNEPDYNSKLAQINSQMNLYSLNRQAIANFLRDTMTMREEIANLTHSVLQKDAQIVSSIAR